MRKSKPKFCVGQLIHHKKFNYHGVVLGVDPEFNNTEEWYEIMAQSRPPKDQPGIMSKFMGRRAFAMSLKGTWKPTPQS